MSLSRDKATNGLSGCRTPSPTRRLNVGVLAHIRHPIAAPFEGGMEAHTWHLVHGLVARGHAVTLYASADSRTEAALVPIVDEHYERRMPWAQNHRSAKWKAHLDAIYRSAWETILANRHDIVHNNSLHPHPIDRARAMRVPMLTSLHVPPFARLRKAVDDPSSQTQRFSVTSARQREIWRAEAPRARLRIVCNGIDPTRWPFRSVGDGSAIWAGRITPNKGTHLAVEAARRAKVPLAIVGVIEDQAYFDREVACALSDTIRHLGHVDGPALAAMFGRASVLLFTPLWEEPFGLVAVEAMACGLPVAYIDRGAAREVIGEGGVAADDQSATALAVALDRALDIPRSVPRDRVERCFTDDRMLAGYESLYRECMADAVQSRALSR